MKKIIKYCSSCDEAFAERFGFCPNCGAQLKLYEMAPQPSAAVSPELRQIASNTGESQSQGEPKMPLGIDIRPELETESIGGYPGESKRASIVQPDSINETNLSGSRLSTYPEPPTKEYGGIGRLGYFLSMGTLGVVHALLSGTGSQLYGNPSAIIPLILIAIALTLTAYRLKNIGISGWWALLALVPIINLVIGYKCLTQQEGYVETGELDGPGQIVRFIYILLGLFVLVVLLYGFCYRPEPPGRIRPG